MLETDGVKVLHLMSDDPRLSSSELELERTTDHTVELLEVVVRETLPVRRIHHEQTLRLCLRLGMRQMLIGEVAH